MKGLFQINNWLRSLPKQYPSIVSLIELKNATYEGRVILGVKVSYGSSKDKKSIFVEANIHAREWYGTYVYYFVFTIYRVRKICGTSVR